MNSEKYEKEKLTNKHHVATPRWLVEEIYDFIDIKNYKSIWLPFDNYDSEFKLLADELDLNYKATHLYDEAGNDFFKTAPPEDCDLLISNPPFNLQNEIIERVYKLVKEKQIKAFCLLLPLSTLETPRRSEVWQKLSDKLSIVILKKRIKFKDKKTTFNACCYWMLYNIKKEKLFWK